MGPKPIFGCPAHFLVRGSVVYQITRLDAQISNLSVLSFSLCPFPSLSTSKPRHLPGVCFVSHFRVCGSVVYQIMCLDAQILNFSVFSSSLCPFIHFYTFKPRHIPALCNVHGVTFSRTRVRCVYQNSECNISISCVTARLCITNELFGFILFIRPF